MTKVNVVVVPLITVTVVMVVGLVDAAVPVIVEEDVIESWCRSLLSCVFEEEESSLGAIAP